MAFVREADINVIFVVDEDYHADVDDVEDAVWKDLGPYTSVLLRKDGEMVVRVIRDPLCVFLL